MPRKGRSNEEIIHALHQVEGGEKVSEVCRRLGVSEQRFTGGRNSSPASGCPNCASSDRSATENSKLKQVLADLTLDRHILQEIRFALTRQPSRRNNTVSRR